MWLLKNIAFFSVVFCLFFVLWMVRRCLQPIFIGCRSFWSYCAHPSRLHKSGESKKNYVIYTRISLSVRIPLVWVSHQSICGFRLHCACVDFRYIFLSLFSACCCYRRRRFHFFPSFSHFRRRMRIYLISINICPSMSSLGMLYVRVHVSLVCILNSLNQYVVVIQAIFNRFINKIGKNEYVLLHIIFFHESIENCWKMYQISNGLLEN